MGKERQNTALALTCVFPALATIFVIARICSRYLGRNFGWDDWLIYAALLLLLGETLCVYMQITLSWTGYHYWEIPEQTVAEKITTMKWGLALQLLYHPLMAAIRASIIVFLFRLQDLRRRVQLALHVVFWINIAYMVSETFVNIFQCSPIDYAYNKPKMAHGKCIDTLRFVVATCACSIIMDLIIIPIPTVMVWNLMMPRKQKILIVILMSMGSIATAASVARLIVYFYRFSGPALDRSHNLGLTLSIIEPSVGIIAACAPALKSLFRHIMPQYFTESDSGYSHGQRQSHSFVSAQRQPTHLEPFEKGRPQANRPNSCARTEEMYGLAALELAANSGDEEIGDLKTPRKAGSTVTGVSDSEEAEPRYMLYPAK